MPIPQLSEHAYAHPARAVIDLRAALAREPDSLDLKKGLGALYLELGRFREAFEQVSSLPREPLALFLNAWALLGLDQDQEALHLLEAECADAELYHVVGLQAGQLGKWVQAEVCFRASIAMAPDCAEYWHSLSISLDFQHRFLESALFLELAASRFEDQLEQRERFRFHMGQNWMLLGNFQNGWPLMEARFGMLGRPGLPELPLPFWRGESLRGRALVLRAEQGAGDSFQFVRFASVLASLGADVFMECSASCLPVLATCKGVKPLAPGPLVLSSGAMQIPLASVPFLLGVDADGIPATVPYLGVPDEVPNRAALERALFPDPGQRRLGLVWGGNPAYVRDQERSLPAEWLETLGDLPGITWVNLQVGHRPAPDLPMLDLVPLLSNYADTAFALERLDGLITVDTGVAHLAGAMGRPTWLLLPWVPDWRWMLDRDDSPRYPTLKLIRQPRPGDWGGVMDLLRAVL